VHAVHSDLPIHTFAAQHVDCLRCAWELVFAGPKHAYPSRIISLFILVSRIFMFWLGESDSPGTVGHAYHRSRRGIPESNQYERKHSCTSHLTTHIELVNKSVDAGFVAGQIFGSSHSGRSSPKRSQRLYWSQKVFVAWCTTLYRAKEPVRSIESTDK
jgi:hypothetical protein